MPEKLGQIFLKNKEIVKKMVKMAGLKSSDLVLEIGPGRGILTEELVKYCGKVIAVEIDKELVSYLRNKFKSASRVNIVKGDILKISSFEFLISNEYRMNEFRISKLGHLPEMLCISKQAGSKLNRNSKFKNRNYKIVANLPYYITSKIIRKFLEAEIPPSEMVLMVQKEVAERICAEPGSMSILSVAVQYYAKPEILFYVDKSNFEPVPEVDSAVIIIKTLKHENIKTPTYNNSINKIFYRPSKPSVEDNKKFFRIVRAGFCARRKMLCNNLANSLHLDKNLVKEKLKTAGIDPTSRAQDLSVGDWVNLSTLLEE